MKKNEKAEKEIMDEKISDAEAQTDEAVKTKADYIAELEKAAVMGKISYADIGRIQIRKDQDVCFSRHFRRVFHFFRRHFGIDRRVQLEFSVCFDIRPAFSRSGQSGSHLFYAVTPAASICRK